MNIDLIVALSSVISEMDARMRQEKTRDTQRIQSLEKRNQYLEQLLEQQGPSGGNRTEPFEDDCPSCPDPPTQ